MKESALTSSNRLGGAVISDRIVASLLEELRQGRQFDVVILCSQLEDMSGLEFLMNIRSMDPKPNVVLFDEGRRQNTSAICLESGDGFCYVGHAELKNLLWELYRLPGRQSQRMERKCQELYEGWGIQLPDVNCNYLSCAVGVVYGTSQKLAIRKEILQAVKNSRTSLAVFTMKPSSGSWKTIPTATRRRPILLLQKNW